MPSFTTSCLCFSLFLSKPGSVWVFMNVLYYFSPHSCFFLPTPANISSFLWITLPYSLMHVISMPRCYLISQQSSFGVEWAEQWEHRRGGIDGGGKGNEMEEGLKLMLPLALTIRVVSASGWGAAWVGWKWQQGVHRRQVAESGTLTLVKYSVRNIKYPKVIKLQFASPLD